MIGKKIKKSNVTIAVNDFCIKKRKKKHILHMFQKIIQTTENKLFF